MNFFKNSASQLLASIALIALQLTTAIILARLLTVPDRGLYLLGIGVPTLLLVFAEMGWSTAAVYRIRRLHIPPRRVFATSVLGVLTGGITFIIIGTLLEGWIRSTLLSDIPRSAYFVGLSCLPALLLSRVCAAVARALDLFNLQNRVRVAGQASLPISLLVVLPLIDRSLRLNVALAIWAGLTWSIALYLLISVAKRAGWMWKIHWRELKDSVGYGLRTALANLAHLLHLKVDVFMMSALLADSSQLAIYGVAASVAAMPQILGKALSTALLPKLAGLPQPDAARFVARVCRNTTAAMVLVSVGLAVVVPFLLPAVYGEPYRASIGALLVLAPAAVPYSVSTLLGRYFAAINRQSVNIFASLISMTLNIGLNLLLVPDYGAVGAAVASLISYTLQSTILVGSIVLTTDQSLRDLLVFKGEDRLLYVQLWQKLKARLGR